MASQVAQENDAVMADVMNLFEAELGTCASDTHGVGTFVAGPDIPALREQLAILVSTGKAIKAIGVQLTHEQVKQLSDKDVEKYCKGYETYVGGKTTETLIETFLMVVAKAVGKALPIKNFEALQKELQSDYIITNELSSLAGNLALECGKFLALANAALITIKHIDFNADGCYEQSPEQSSATAEQLLTNAE